MNITFSTKPATSMDSTLLTIGSLHISYETIIIYGLFAILIFIGLAVWIMSYKRGG